MGVQTGAYNVVMIGEKRLGKTSILASMMNSFNKVGTAFIVNPADGVTKDAMKNKIISLQKAFVEAASGNGLYYDNDNDATSGLRKYTFDISYKNSNSEKIPITKIIFYDIPGEFFSNDKNQSDDFEDKYDNQLKGLIGDADILVFAIDSVGLMERTKEQYGFYSKPEELETRISGCLNVHKNRTILLVPLKCEKYYHSGKMGELKDKVLDLYNPIIHRFSNGEFKSSTTICVTPILTMGNMVFDDFMRDEKGLVVRNRETRRPERAYYKVLEGKNFAPKYCEQPLLHVFFMLTKEKQTANKQYVEDAYTPTTNEDSIAAFVAGKTGGVSPEKIVIGLLAGAATKIYFWGKHEIKHAYRQHQYNNDSFNSLTIRPKKSGDGYFVIQNPFGM